MSTAQLSAYVFTINNPEGLLDFEGLPRTVRYLIYSEEIGDSGTNHFQGYIEFTRTVRRRFVKKALGCPGAHVEPRRGTQLEAIAYCHKSDSHVDGPYIFGTPAVGQGTRTDLVRLKADLDSGMDMREIADRHFASFLRFDRSIQLYKSLKDPEPDRQRLIVSLYYGPTGTGKSLSCRLTWPDAYWRSSTTGSFWGTYTNQRVLVLDDFYGWLPFHELLRILDPYPLEVSVKGYTRKACFDRVILTSNRLPNEWYKDPRLDLAALVRRIHKFLLFRENWESPALFTRFSELEYQVKTAISPVYFHNNLFLDLNE